MPVGTYYIAVYDAGSTIGYTVEYAVEIHNCPEYNDLKAHCVLDQNSKPVIECKKDSNGNIGYYGDNCEYLSREWQYEEGQTGDITFSPPNSQIYFYCETTNGDCHCGNARECECHVTNGNCHCNRAESCTGSVNNGNVYYFFADSDRLNFTSGTTVSNECGYFPCDINSTDDTTSGNSDNIPIIAGAVGGGTLVFLIIAYCCWKRCKKNKVVPDSNTGKTSVVPV